METSLAAAGSSMQRSKYKPIPSKTLVSLGWGFSWRPGTEPKAHIGHLSTEGRVAVSDTRRKRQIHRA